MCHGRSWTPVDLAAQRLRDKAWRKRCAARLEASCPWIVHVSSMFRPWFILARLRQPTVKRGDFDGRGDFDNLIKLIIWIPNSCSYSCDCRLFILPCLSDHMYLTETQLPMLMNEHYLVSRTHNCIDMLGLLISRFYGTIHIYKHTVKHNHGQNHCN